jgi:hypothetical protein
MKSFLPLYIQDLEQTNTWLTEGWEGIQALKIGVKRFFYTPLLFKAFFLVSAFLVLGYTLEFLFFPVSSFSWNPLYGFIVALLGLLSGYILMFLFFFLWDLSKLYLKGKAPRYRK